MSNAFDSIVESYKSGRMDNALDLVFSTAADNGVILLPGSDRPYTKAANGSYAVADLLLPVDRTTWKNLSTAYSAGIDIFPAWFHISEDGKYLEYTQEDFVKSFVRAKNLTMHHGTFLMNGTPVSKPDVKNAIRRSLSIIRKDSGKLVLGMYEALRVMCVDTAPEDDRGRLTIDALSAELDERGYKTRLNIITGEYEITGRSPTGRNLTQDDILVLMHDELSDAYKGVSFDALTQYMAFLSRENAYNPVLDLLSTTQWDGVDRFPQVYQLLGVEDDYLSKTLIGKWFLQAIALLFNDDTEPFGADGCLVLNGKELGIVDNQGAGKTSFFRHLAMKNQWFAEGCSIDDRDKDTTRRVITKWVSELGEVESTLKSDLSKLKAFITSSTDRYRLPYGRSDTVTPRRTSLCATCNSDRYLIDVTGNRRWWTIPVNRVIPREELLQLDALQLWSQVYTIVAPLSYAEKSACFRLTEEEKKMLSVRNGEFEKLQKGEAEVRDILAQAKESNLTWQQLTVSQWKEYWPVLRQYSVQQIGQALKCCGLEPKHTNKGRFVELPTPNPSNAPWN